MRTAPKTGISLGRWLSWSLGAMLMLGGCYPDPYERDNPFDPDSPNYETPFEDLDGDGYDASLDCDDDNAAINPGAAEKCDGLDNDCDLDEDEDLPINTFYLDEDGDGFGDESSSHCGNAGQDEVINPGDCDDDDPDIHPGADELCNQEDDDCDDRIDEGLDSETWYPDEDDDGYGDEDEGDLYCERPNGYVDQGGDCDDDDDEINPEATEVCDEQDNDCNGQVDEGLGQLYYPDGDSDGFGDVTDAGAFYCEPPTGFVSDHTDCNDNAAAAHPGADEVCDGLDNDCDGDTDEGFPTTVYFSDADGDGYGANSSTGQEACVQPTGTVEIQGDCDDQDRTVNPDAEELCDGKDNDCDGELDPTGDTDGDGSSDCDDCADEDPEIAPNLPELLDGVDQNCDGLIDNGVRLPDSADVTLEGKQGRARGLIVAEVDGKRGLDLLVQAGTADVDGGDAGNGVLLFSGPDLTSSDSAAADATFLTGVQDAGDGLAVGDINGDGRVDLILSGNVNRGKGSIYVFLGRDGGFVGAYEATDADFTVSGNFDGDRFGASIAAVDGNGDGAADLFIGAPGTEGGSGSVYLVPGNSGELKALEIVLEVTGSAAAALGSTLAVTYDDETPSLWVAAPGTDEGRGRLYQLIELSRLFGFSPGSFFPITDVAPVTFTAPLEGEAIGTTLAYAGDVNQDGFGDLLLTGGVAGDEVVYLLPGASRSLSEELALGDAAVEFRTEEGIDLGAGIAGIGDFNEDGIDDFAISGVQRAPDDTSSDEAVVYLVFGTTGELGGDLADVADLSFGGPAIPHSDLVPVAGGELTGAPINFLVISAYGYGTDARDGLLMVLDSPFTSTP